MQVHRRFGSEIAVKYYPNAPAAEFSLVSNEKMKHSIDTSKDFLKINRIKISANSRELLW